MAGGGEGTLYQHLIRYLDLDTVFSDQLNFSSMPFISSKRGQEMERGSRWFKMLHCCPFHLSFLAPLPFSFIPYQAVPKTRSGQKVPWAEWKLASQHLLPVLVNPEMSVRPNMHSLKYNDIVPADVVVKANTPI